MKGSFGIALLVTAASTAAWAAAPHHTPAQGRAAIRHALADPARTDDAANDARRAAATVLAFSGVGPGDQVVDFFPGSGYWTRLFSPIVGPAGHVYALWPQWGAKYATKPLPALQARGLTNVTAALLPSDAISTPRPVDLVWTVQNYHDLPNDGRGEDAIRAFNASVYRALKPGGTYVVIDHAAKAGDGLRDTDTLHRIDAASVKAEVTAAGFRFVGSSDALRNPADDHSKLVFDPAIRGHTDQFVLKFRKP